MLSKGMTPADICAKALEGMPFDILDTYEPAYRCTCSRQKVERALLSMKPEELLPLPDDEGKGGGHLSILRRCIPVFRQGFGGSGSGVGAYHEMRNYSKKVCRNLLTNRPIRSIIYSVADGGAFGSIAQLGRAPALQAGGHRFEPCCSHHCISVGPVVQLVRTLACHARGRRVRVPFRVANICLCSSVGRAVD